MEEEEEVLREMELKSLMYSFCSADCFLCSPFCSLPLSTKFDQSEFYPVLVHLGAVTQRWLKCSEVEYPEEIGQFHAELKFPSLHA